MADVVEQIRVALVEGTGGLPVSHSIHENHAWHLFRVGSGTNGVVTQWVPINVTADLIPAIVEDTLVALKDLKDSTYG